MKDLRPLLWLALGLVACQPEGSGGDCRQATRTCAAGFICQQTDAQGWTCVPGGAGDAAVGAGDGGVPGTPDARAPGADASGMDASEGPGPDPRDAGADARPTPLDAGGDARPLTDGPLTDGPLTDGPLTDAAPTPDGGAAAPPGAPCAADGDCAGSARCDLTVADGRCRLDCAGGCPGGTACAEDAAGATWCAPDCEADDDCRDGWICVAGTCGPGCPEVPCAADDLCVQGRCGGACVEVPEVCNGRDDDCDGDTDEGTLNACGACGPVPAEVCNLEDDDCDGDTDEGVRNPCGDCGPLRAEVCNGLDEDCDGRNDEGVSNACGGCGPAPAEVCDGEDDDCDGRTDEAVDCPEGQSCQAGRCRPVLSGEGGPCAVDADCAAGTCFTGANWPGGFCRVECERGGDCDSGHCGQSTVGSLCLASCGDDLPCRDGWVCADGTTFCVPSCPEVPCQGFDECLPSGECVSPTYYDVTLQQVLLSVAKASGEPWDGLGAAVAQEVIDAFVAELESDDPLGGLIAFFGSALVRELEKPDAYGVLFIEGPGLEPTEIELVERNNTFAPRWDAGYTLVPANDAVRLVIELSDADVLLDDDVGRVVITADDIRQAAGAGGPHPIRVDAQGTGQIVLVVLDVQRSP